MPDPAVDRQIIELLDTGLTYVQIGEAMGLTKGQVAGIIHRIRHTGAAPATQRRVTVKTYVHGDFAREARRRGLKTSALIERVLTKVAADNLFAAVLD